ncbi:MAG: sporulation integral membrane protein YlbJ [Clostridiaceae bacterium]
MNKTNYILISILTLILIKMISAPAVCISYALMGANLFFYKVFPSLFPFIVLCNLIISFNGIEIYSKLIGSIITKPFKISKRSSLVLIISLLCGYPLGAKYAAALYNNGEIDYPSYNKLVNIASNPSPFFVIVAVGLSMLHSLNYGYILIASCYLSCIFMGLIINGKGKDIYFSGNNYKNNNIGEALGNSINNGTTSCLLVLSYVIIFSIIIGLIKSSKFINTAFIFFSDITHIDKNIIFSIFSGIIEMTNGCSLVSNINCSIKYKLMMLSFILSFSSFSVILQVNSFIYKTKFSIKKYISRKFIQGLISCAITYIIFTIYSF